MVTNKAEDVLQTVLHVQDGGKIEQIAVTEAFWSDLLSGARPELDQGRLISAFSFSQDWPSWERHPAGEELVMLLGGATTLVLEEVNGERELPLETVGRYVLVPRGVWHTARTTQPTTLLFITPGAGTEHRSV